MLKFTRAKWPAARRWGLLLSLGATAAAFRPASPPDDALAVLRRLVLGLQDFYRVAQPEKAYLHLDKPVYTAGETIWLRAYVVDATLHQPDTLSGVLHVELLSEQQRVVGQRTLRLAQGLAAGQLALPDTLAPGTYLLRAYTSWMRNADPGFFYTRRLQVWPAATPEAVPENRAAFQRVAARAQRAAKRAATPPDIQFLPEGGSLVEGLESVVAFKAVAYTGSGIDVTGQVLDAQNQLVATFSSTHLGMGFFRLTPAPGQHYHAVVASPQAAAVTVPLPVAQASGYTLHVTSTTDAYQVSIRQHGGRGGAVLLLGQVRGAVGYLGQGQVLGDEPFTARIAKSKFASGIVHFTLFDGQGHPLAERLAFGPSEPALRISLTPDQPSYGPQQPVRVRVAVADAAGQPVAASLSVAVADAGLADADTDNIATRLLLTSDLAGYVENPGYYFQDPSPEAAQALDALLLTQGWRRFAWEPVLAGRGPAPGFGVARSLGLLGQVTRPNGAPAAHSTLTFLQAKPTKLALSLETDAEGRFLVNGLGGCDTIRATLQTRTATGQQNLVIRLDPGPAIPLLQLPPLPLTPAPPLAAALANSQLEQAAEHRFALDNTIALNTVSVQGQRAVLPDTRRLYGPGMATVVEMDRIPSAHNSSVTVLQALQGRVPGLSITGSEPNIHVQIRGITSFTGSSDPLVLIDGAYSSVDALANYLASEVETVEVLKGGQAAIFGSRGAAGVLAVYTRQGNLNKPAQVAVPGVLAVRLPAFSCPQQFYAPRYGADAPPPTRPDTRRSTLYWNPNVRTDANGQAEFTFFTSAARGLFQLTAEGLAPTGRPALGTGRLVVK
ncbi:MAG: hypothetical protein EOO59_01220 [Hymenobacter sp.]|nr:MAG: hypothetical protein EOO59_01220 [Hymenobacter sp.]